MPRGLSPGNKDDLEKGSAIAVLGADLRSNSTPSLPKESRPGPGITQEEGRSGVNKVPVTETVVPKDLTLENTGGQIAIGRQDDKDTTNRSENPASSVPEPKQITPDKNMTSQIKEHRGASPTGVGGVSNQASTRTAVWVNEQDGHNKQNNADPITVTTNTKGKATFTNAPKEGATEVGDGGGQGPSTTPKQDTRHNPQKMRVPLEDLDKHLIRGYLLPTKPGEAPPLQLRRTLDQYFYTHLASTSERDSDQVVFRYTSQGPEPKMFMVDQLWLWILNDGTVFYLSRLMPLL